MKFTLEITKAGKCLHRDTYDLVDSDTFGAAWKDVWVKARKRWMSGTTSIGELMDSINESVLEELDDAQIKLRKL